MDGLLSWAESLGERLGEQIAARIRARGLPEPERPPRAAPPVRRTRRPAEPRRRGPGRPRRVPDVPLEEFRPGRVVEFHVGRREAAGSIVKVDAERARVTVLDLGTNETIERPAWELRLVTAAPFVVRKRAGSGEPPVVPTPLPPESPLPAS